MREARAAEVIADERIDGLVLAKDETAGECGLAAVEPLSEGCARPVAGSVEGAGQPGTGAGQRPGRAGTQLKPPPLTAGEIGEPRLDLTQRAGGGEAVADGEAVQWAIEDQADAPARGRNREPRLAGDLPRGVDGEPARRAPARPLRP